MSGTVRTGRRLPPMGKGQRAAGQSGMEWLVISGVISLVLVGYGAKSLLG